ncbi:MAG: gliding motility-associated C-terminal domain-containing protein [Chitinophagales bacterium]|nr:gliding motility-associated C-terminal domain-containing protein [Chitinophagales bacterium]
MKKYLTILLLLFGHSVFAQNFNLDATTTVNLDCGIGGVLFDSGGAGADYAGGQNFAFTICTNGDPLSVEVVSVLMGAGDFLAVFDGTNSSTAPLLFVFDENNSLAPGTLLRASAANATGCLTFQISSDVTINGSFEFDLSCLPACQSIEAEILNSTPLVSLNDTNYVDLCPDDSLIITATGFFAQNNIAYAQSDASSQFFWDFGAIGLDTGQTVVISDIPASIYTVSLIVEDVNGCRSINELPIKIRQAPDPLLTSMVEDSILCLNEMSTIYSQIFNQTIDSVITGDTIRLESSVSVTDTVFLPDDANNISGDGITTPVIYELPITGYQQGAQILAVNDLIEVCLDIEHSYIGDLDIVLVCPSGQSVSLIDFTPPNAFSNELGISAFVGQGVPFTYCWSPLSTAGSIAGGQPALVNDPVLAGTYEATGNWANLIGCPLNGIWEIQIFDDFGGDDGHTFGASASFNPALLASNDSLIVTYQNPLWQPNNNISSSLNNDSIQITLTDTSQTDFYFSVEDNLGCQFFDTSSIIKDVYRVVASPDSVIICSGESVQLFAEIEPNDNISCETNYDVYSIPYYKEFGADTSIVFTQADNGVSQIIDLPFAFPIFCVNQSQLRLTSNGYLQFGASAFSLANNLTIPANIVPNNIIALMWDDLIDSLGTSSYFTVGTAPNRRFVINLDLVHVGGSVATERVLGQIILHESQNYFDLICENCQNDVSDPTATQGTENFTGFFGAVTPGRNNTNWSASNSAYRYFPQNSLNTYTTSWTPAGSLSGANTPSPLASPSSSTQYIVDITSPNNCTYSDTLFILAGGSYSYSVSNDTTICLGDTVQLSAAGGSQSFAWAPNNGSISDSSIFNPLVYPNTTTTYGVALDSAGCVAFDSVTITVSNVTVDSTLIILETCVGQADASIEIVTSGAVNPQYSINGGISFSPNNIFQPLAAGLYDIVVNENGLCDTSYQVNIVGGTPLVFDSIVFQDPLCGNINDGIIDVYVSSGIQPYTYSIDGGLTNQVSNSFSGLAGGTYQVYLEDSLGCFIDSLVDLNQAASLAASIMQVDSILCFASNDGQIEVGATGGQAPYQFSIDNVNFAPDSIFTNLSAAVYTVFVLDTNLCIDSIDIEVFAPVAISLTSDSTNVSCKDLADGTATVTASGGSGSYTYTWDDALLQTTATAFGLDTGNYQVIVIDGNGCQDSITINIDEPDSLLLSLDNVTNILCNGASTGEIAVSTSGGSLPYTYQWSNGGGANEDVIASTAGSYTLTVTDGNNCNTQLTSVINEPLALGINLTETNLLCFGDNTGAVDASVSGGVLPYNYSWTGPNGFTENQEDLAGLAAGSYTLTVTDSNNCLLSQLIALTQPGDGLITFTGSAVNCFGDNDGSLTAQIASGGTPPFQFQWDAAANNQNTATALGLIAGTYSVTVTDGNGCTYSNSASVSEPLLPLSVILDSTFITCAGYSDGTATATVSGGTAGYTYLWNDPLGQTTAIATGLSSNSYQVSVTDANGCSISGSVTIEEPTPVVVVATPDSANCWGDASGSVNVFATGGTGLGYSYSIDGGETFQSSPDFIGLPAGVYAEIIVQDLGSNSLCLSQLSSTTVYEQPYFSFVVVPADTTLQLEESITLSLTVTSPNYADGDITQVSWFPTTGLNCSDCIDPTVLTYENYTTYTATAYYVGDDEELCNTTANTTIQLENNLQLFIPNAFTPGSFDNVNNTFEVFGEGIEYVTMQVFNRWGEKVFESSNQQVSWDGTLKGEMQGPGVFTYYVNVQYLDGKIIDRKGSVTLLR